MIAYKASFRTEGDVVLAEVLDFPGVLSFGHTLDEARGALAGALRDMAETLILEGRPLPSPNPEASREDSDVEEPIALQFTVAVNPAA
jgi:predicted RNase H-like HicB family nuclease